MDNGYVTLVNARVNADGNLYETPEKTNIWAWKHPHEDGTVTYEKVRGDVRFYDLADGKIRYDGININKIKKADLRRSLGIVLQDTNLFTGTIRDNIRYGNLSATDEEVEAAASLANADDFIRRLPDGYDTEIGGDGGSLSQERGSYCPSPARRCPIRRS